MTSAALALSAALLLRDSKTSLGSFFLILFGGGILFSLLGMLVKKIIPRFVKEYEDFPVSGSGHWGVEINPVRIEKNDEAQEAVKYFLPISLTNADSVDRILKTILGSGIIKQNQK